MTETAAEATTEQAPPEGEPKTFDAEYVSKLRSETAKYRTEARTNADAARRLAEIEEAQKTEQQKLTDRALAAERERDEARLDALRLKVGAAKNLPADLVDVLRGSTEEELAAHAEKLSAYAKPAVRADPDQGPRAEAPKTDMNAALRAAFGR